MSMTSNIYLMYLGRLYMFEVRAESVALKSADSISDRSSLELGDSVDDGV